MVKIKVEKISGKYTVDELLQIMKMLRSPDGCPWDREQTHGSIRSDLLEEAYEVADAIDKKDDASLCEELGDLLLQVVFHSEIAQEDGTFDFDDVVDGICRKLIHRHPHVFGDAAAENSDEVLDLWDSVKIKEKHQESFTDTLKSVPDSFPALMRSAKVQKRAFKAGLKMTGNMRDAMDEFSRAVALGEPNEIERTYGNTLFALAGMQRKLGIDAEQALNRTTDEFIKKFEKAEKIAAETNASIDEAFKK